MTTTNATFPTLPRRVVTPPLTKSQHSLASHQHNISLANSMTMLGMCPWKETTGSTRRGSSQTPTNFPPLIPTLEKPETSAANGKLFPAPKYFCQAQHGILGFPTVVMSLQRPAVTWLLQQPQQPQQAVVPGHRKNILLPVHDKIVPIAPKPAPVKTCPKTRPLLAPKKTCALVVKRELPFSATKSVNSKHVVKYPRKWQSKGRTRIVSVKDFREYTNGIVHHPSPRLVQEERMAWRLEETLDDRVARQRPVTTLLPTDVILGRGFACYNAPGNRKFRDMTTSYRAIYKSTQHAEGRKRAITQSIENFCRAQGVRFLEKSTDDKNRDVYYEVGTKRSLEKVAQSLREIVVTSERVLERDAQMVVSEALLAMKNGVTEV